MKLQNKKTGAVKDWDLSEWLRYITNPGGEEFYECSLTDFMDRAAEFREEWEDAPEEPKKYWFINSCGVVEVRSEEEQPTITDMRKQFGNYFETKEAAEKAVEKLKAWKRLKDKGIRITGWKFTTDMKHTKGNFVTIKAEIPYIVENQADLDLLFGGEE